MDVAIVRYVCSCGKHLHWHIAEENPLRIEMLCECGEKVSLVVTEKAVCLGVLKTNKETSEVPDSPIIN